MSHEEAIARKRESRRQTEIVAGNQFMARLELRNARMKVAEAKRLAEASAGRPASTREVYGLELLAAVGHFRDKVAVAQEWGVV